MSTDGTAGFASAGRAQDKAEYTKRLAGARSYRDAWIAFACLRYPAAVAAIRAAITLDRFRLLKTIR